MALILWFLWRLTLNHLHRQDAEVGRAKISRTNMFICPRIPYYVPYYEQTIHKSLPLDSRQVCTPCVSRISTEVTLLFMTASCGNQFHCGSSQLSITICHLEPHHID
jgi:hypothetical protein